MIRSMTGFGKGEARFKKGKIVVEIKTVNHKFFDATLKLPNGIILFEDDIKSMLQKEIKRGKVNLNLIYDSSLLKGGRIAIDKLTARNYYEELLKLKKALHIDDNITIKDIVGLPGVLNYEATEEDLVDFWPKVKKALDEAIGHLTKDREKEGKALQKDLLARTKRIGKLVDGIKARSHLNISEYRKKFVDRIKDLTGGRDIDRGRLEIEVAIFAKNSDISEEITRLKNHLINFAKTILSDGEVGKKIDFIAQELHRETNTIGSKASDFKIAQNVIEIKGEIEKIREQAKNLE